jgi:hypothetical protein
VHSKKIGTFFTAGLTHFFLVLFINVEGPLYRAIAPTMGACNAFVSIVEQNQWTCLLSGFSPASGSPSRPSIWAIKSTALRLCFLKK